jgi:hypothetical protein
MRSTSNGHPFVQSNTPLGRLVKNLADQFKYPYSSADGQEYVDAIKANTEKFIKVIYDFNESDEFINKLKNNIHEYEQIGNNLIDVINSYLTGNASSAYELMERTITSEFVGQYWGKLRLKINGTYQMFRARESSGSIETTDEMFHIPFNQRHLVKAQRYSIAGVPCLYLGSSTFVCWLEMGRPDLNRLYFSSFKPSTNDEIIVLDLTTSFGLLISRTHLIDFVEVENYQERQEYIEAVVATWLISQACSFKKKHLNANFNIEYIIPSLLLQWVKENKEVDGIRYSSTHYDFRPDPERGYNYVFPPKMINGKFCERLCYLFTLTKPASWQILQALSSKRILGAKVTKGCTSSFEDQLLTEYFNTSFGTIERILSEDDNKMQAIRS